jgi:CheY-like chemotaxis protein
VSNASTSRSKNSGATDLNDAVARIAPALRKEAGDNIAVSFVFTSEPALIIENTRVVERLILSLVADACGRMPGGGELFMETSRTSVADSFAALCLSVPIGEYVVLAVTDTGAGTTGSGAEPSGYFISRHSLPGVGTVVRILFPVAYPGVDVSSAPDAETGPGGNETILLVEDNLAIRRYLRVNLVQRGYEVLDAANGGDAVLLASRHKGRIDLLLADFGLPDADGAEIAESIASLQPGIRVLYMSGHLKSPRMAEYGEKFMQKPFRFAELLLGLRAIFDSRSAAG